MLKSSVFVCMESQPILTILKSKNTICLQIFRKHAKLKKNNGTASYSMRVLCLDVFLFWSV